MRQLPVSAAVAGLDTGFDTGLDTRARARYSTTISAGVLDHH